MGNNVKVNYNDKTLLEPKNLKFKFWLKLNEVLKLYKTSYSEIIKEVHFNKIQLTVVDDNIWFNKANLDIVFKDKIKKHD